MVYIKTQPQFINFVGYLTAMQGDRIREAMVHMRWSNAELCRALIRKGYDITPAAIGKWFNGQTSNVKAEYLFGIQDLTGFSARYLAEGRLPKMVSQSASHVLDDWKGVYDLATDEAKRMIINFLMAVKLQQQADDQEENRAKPNENGKRLGVTN